MACGKPVITTDYSAHTEFCTSDNAHLIDWDELEDAYDGKWFHGQGQWMEFEDGQMEQLVNYMRVCYETRPSNIAGLRTAEEYSWERTADLILEYL